MASRPNTLANGSPLKESHGYELEQNERPSKTLANDAVASSEDAPLYSNRPTSSGSEGIHELPSVTHVDVEDGQGDSPNTLPDSSQSFRLTAFNISAHSMTASEKRKLQTSILGLPQGHEDNNELESAALPALIYGNAPVNHMTEASPQIPGENTSGSAAPITMQNHCLEGDIAAKFDMEQNERLPERLADTSGQPGSISWGQHHPEAIKGRERFSHSNQRLRRRLVKLHSLHSEILKTRALLYEKRSQLRHLRSAMASADDNFMKLIRKGRAQESYDHQEREACYGKLQTARKEYELLEKVYNDLEEQLNREDYDLTEFEGRILEKYVSIQGDCESNTDTLSSVDGHSDTLEFIRDQGHPLYEEYMSRLGDADLCREVLDNLITEYKSLLEKEEISRRHGGELRPEDQTKLAKFLFQKAKISEDLGQIEADVERLRLECVQNGLLFSGRKGEAEGGEEVESDGEDEFRNKDVGENEIDGESEGDIIDADSDILKLPNGIMVGPEHAEHNKYPLLLPRPGELEEEKKIQSLISEFNPGDTGDRITRWLLHKLRSSCSEVELLARYSGGLGSTMDSKKWQEGVLKFWFVDSANLPPSAYLVEPTPPASPPLSFSDPRKVTPTRFSDAQLIQLYIRSPTSSQKLKLEFTLWLNLERMKGGSASIM